MLSRIIAEHKVAAKVWINSIWYGFGPAIFTGSFILVMILLQWAFNYELFWEIMIDNNARLPFSERLDIFLDAIANVFRYANDLTPISLILISFFQASIVTIWWRVRLITRASRLRVGAIGIGIFGSGCVACGSSLLPLILETIGAALSVSLVQRIGDFLLIVAVILSYRAAIKLALRVSTALV